MVLNRRLSIAPMLDYTDRHFRYFMRLLTKHTLLYTEMITTGALLQGKRHDLLAYDPSEHPIALQLGGCHPDALTECAKMAEDYGYDEVNLNVGCPSNRVQAGRFGACLMAEPHLVGECIAAMQSAVKIPVTVKTRIGIDRSDSYEHLDSFIQIVSKAGCETFIIHARKAWLDGLSPKDNRTIPPLRYNIVQQVKQNFPHLQIVLNGGIMDLTQGKSHLEDFDGVMLGRAAYKNPYLFSNADEAFFGSAKSDLSRERVLQNYIPYIKSQLETGVRLPCLIRPLLGIYQGVTGGRVFRRSLSESSPEKIFSFLEKI
jgi:tRNA-dihydrouridine synthase A